MIQLNQFTTQWHLQRDRISTSESPRARAKNQAVLIMKKETTELDNKIKLLKLKIAKTEEIIPKPDKP